jgi:hypothetical protein
MPCYFACTGDALSMLDPYLMNAFGMQEKYLYLSRAFSDCIREGFVIFIPK